MKIFLDTGSIQDIESFVALGIVDGVTTNPSLMAKEKGDPRAITKRICEIVKGPGERRGARDRRRRDDSRGARTGRDRHARRDQAAVRQGRRPGMRGAQRREIPVNMTLIFSPTQALLAAKVGAAYVSPFIGRLDDIATEGMNLIEEIVDIFQNYALHHRRSSWPASGTRCTSSRPRGSAPTSARARRPSSRRCSSTRSPTSGSNGS